MAISMDMKYTALYWALRFVENELDVHVKEYSGYKIIIDAEKQSHFTTSLLFSKKENPAQPVLCRVTLPYLSPKIPGKAAHCLSSEQAGATPPPPQGGSACCRF